MPMARPMWQLASGMVGALVIDEGFRGGAGDRAGEGAHASARARRFSIPSAWWRILPRYFRKRRRGFSW